MRIGIFTFHGSHNYGAMLQAYALQQKLIELKHEVQIVHFNPEHVLLKNKRSQKISSLRDLFVRAIVLLLSVQFTRRYENFDSFMKQKMKLTRRYVDFDDLSNDPPKFDAYVCGSDQIWNIQNFINPVFFLRFAPKDILKIAYAPSFGRDKIPKERKDILANWVSEFDAVSVRESSGVEILKEATGVAPVHVLDPVFLLTDSTWNNIAIEPNFKGKYLLFYSLEVSNNLSKLVKLISKRLNLPVVILGKGGSFVFTCKSKMAIDSGPAEFLGWFRHAAFVITNSFHAVAFSIIYQKPFYTIEHSTHNARMESLLKMTSLNSRQIDDLDELKLMSDIEITSINYSPVMQILEEEKAKSIAFLEDAFAEKSQ